MERKLVVSGEISETGSLDVYSTCSVMPRVGLPGGGLMSSQQYPEGKDRSYSSWSAEFEWFAEGVGSLAGF